MIVNIKLFDNDERSLTYYIRIGKKMWIVGDSKGYNSFYHDGELIDRTNTNICLYSLLFLQVNN